MTVNFAPSAYVIDPFKRAQFEKNLCPQLAHESSRPAAAIF